ncbi:BCSC C-terminal domain-containing protein [Vibrio sp. JC009]|uniref:cellulose biosynthesis protein BcsC n=1 Tax=Vibrio sp. JC009 TaxID=2912314 RepID=UPI0023B186D5|nr:cellulose biosynthesis protein BcsC [Vibrio sp. JC009]WED20651.1 BCSC C-terminal domain-containing protein [Vibrio sp. JC009]
MKNKKTQLFATVCLLEALAVGLGSAPVLAAEGDSANVQALIEQANYWHDRSNDKLAGESINKILMIDANHAEALYLKSLWAEQQGDADEAQLWRERLEKADPSSPYLESLKSSNQVKKLPQDKIAKARQQSNSGDIKGSLATWDSVFQGQEPSGALAMEYYQTMAGDKSRYGTAVKKLEGLSKLHPNNTAMKIAYAEALTYREKTRRSGIKILEGLADSQPDADKSLRQSLLWLNPKTSDKSHYDKWMSRHPKDATVMNYYKKKQKGTATTDAFSQLNSGNVEAAKKSFQKVLKVKPNNADALAGMGYVYLHQGDNAKAAKYLNRSADQGGKQAKKRRQQAKEAAFYSELAKAQAAYKDGNIQRALELSKPLSVQPGELGISAKLFRADLLRQDGEYAQSESLLRSVLKADHGNNEAKEQLYYVLTEQDKTKEAKSVLSSLPQDVRTRIQKEDTYGNIRNLANQAASIGNTETAVVILENGVSRLPNNPWLRLELARMQKKLGRNYEAESTISQLYRSDANNEEVYVAALYSQDAGDWKRVNSLLSRIPEDKRDGKVKELYAESLFNLKLQLAEKYLSHGDKSQAMMVLKNISAEAQESPLKAGQVASLMMKAGGVEQAVSLVKQNIAGGIKGNASEYTNHVTVLYQAGLRTDAQNLLNDPKLRAKSTPEQLSQARNIFVIKEADRLRNMGSYAEAYDLLLQALQQDPHNTDLMLAMARLYQSGDMNDKAGTVYDYLLANNLDTPEQSARVGAINAALASKQTKKARALADGLTDTKSPSNLLLLARVAEAEGNNKQAVALLKKARGSLLGATPGTFDDGSEPQMQGGMLSMDNPFRAKPKAYNTNTAQSVYGVTMPWQKAGPNQSVQVTNAQGESVALNSEKLQTLQQVDEMLIQMDERTSSWVQGKLSIRNRVGESGLSQLTEVKAPLEFSTIPVSNDRLTVSVTPVALAAGSSSGDASREFGTGALEQGESASSSGTSTLNGDELPDVASQGSQSDAGVELAVALEGDTYKVDVGTTPLGAEKSTLVGGVQWTPRITNNSTLTLAAERRSINESILSYVGVVDEFSGDYWGLVTKNGIRAGVNYDNSKTGMYFGVAAYKYLGTNVADNDSIELNTGMYSRLVAEKNREFRLGVNLLYKDFSENLSYFSYGQGGYFSPQDQWTLSFPVEYKHDFLDSDVSLSIGGSLGYQSYDLDSSAYFPDDASLQTQLEDYVTLGYAEEAYYDENSVSGVGYNFHAALEYELEDNMTLGASAAFDAFDDYNEYLAQVWLRRYFDE